MVPGRGHAALSQPPHSCQLGGTATLINFMHRRDLCTFRATDLNHSPDVAASGAGPGGRGGRSRAQRDRTIEATSVTLVCG
jgi:hypothetical protein